MEIMGKRNTTDTVTFSKTYLGKKLAGKYSVDRNIVIYTSPFLSMYSLGVHP